MANRTAKAVEDALVTLLQTTFATELAATPPTIVEVEAVTPLGPDDVLEHHRVQGRSCYLRTLSEDYTPHGAGPSPSYDRRYRWQIWVMEPIREGAARETRNSLMGYFDTMLAGVSNAVLFSTEFTTSPIRLTGDEYRVIGNSYAAAVLSAECVAEYNGSA